MHQYVSYKDSEVAWGTGDVSSRGQGLGDVLQAEGCGQDPQGQPDHQIALGAFERPAVTRVHVRLMAECGKEREDELHNSSQGIAFPVINKSVRIPHQNRKH